MHSNVENYIENQLAKDILKDTLAVVKIVKIYSEGKSGAKVFLIDISGERLSENSIRGKYVLKVDDNSIEKENYDELFFSKNIFCKNHILPLECPCKEIDSSYFMIMPVAGHNMDLYEETYKLIPQKQRELTQSLSRDLLNELNKNCFCCDDHSISDILGRLLGSKLRENSALHAYLNEYNNNIISRPSFIIYNQILPNPFFYATSDKEWSIEKIRTINGLVHGDLHGMNIFSNKENQEEYFLIDLANFTEDGFVFFDNAYLEVSFLLDFSDGIAISDWFGLIEGITEKSEERLKSYSLDFYKLAVGIQEEERKFIEENLQGNKDVALRQSLLMRFVAGLNFAGKKGMEGVKRQKALLYSALFLRKYFLLTHKELDSNTFPFYNDQAESQYEIDELKDFVDYFDNSISNFVLVSGDISQPFHEDDIDVLSNVSWKLVLDFCKDSLSNIYLNAFRESLKVKTAIDILHIGNSGLNKINFNINDIWFYACGVTDYNETIRNDFKEWRKEYVPHIKNILGKLSIYTESKEPCFVIDAGGLKSSGITELYIDEIIRIIADVFDENARIAILDSNDKVDYSERYYMPIQSFKCSINGLVSVIRQYVAGNKRDSVTLKNHLRENVTFNVKDLSRFSGCFDLISGYLALRVADSEKPFYFGYDISWQEIANRMPIERNKFEGELVNKINAIIAEKKRGIITLKHNPGAGGTIVLKSTAWKIKDTYTTIFLKSSHETAVLYIQELYEKMKSHIVIFVDQNLGYDEVVQLSAQLKGYSIKHVIVTASHNSNGESAAVDKDTKQHDLTLTVVEDDEKAYFNEYYTRYINEKNDLADSIKEQRIDFIGNLTYFQNQAKYRVPYFYGLIAFEKEFYGLEKYLNDVYNLMNKDAKIKMTYELTAFITFYATHYGIPHKGMTKLLENNAANRRKIIDTLNSNNCHVIIANDNMYRITHTTIAEDILEHVGAKPNSLQLYQLSEQFVNFIFELACEHSLKEDICKTVFLKRIGGEDEKDRFSKCIMDIKASEHKLKIFELLVDKFPDNPYFHAHLGRAIIELYPSKYTEACNMINIALDKAKDSNIKAEFYHIMGMVCYRHMHYYLKLIPEGTKIYDFWNQISFCVDEAEVAFMNAVKFGTDTDANNKTIDVAYEKLIDTVTHFIREIKKRARRNCEEFSIDNTTMPVSKWCFEKLSTATDAFLIIESNNSYSKGKKELVEKYLLESTGDIERIKKIAEDNHSKSRIFARRLVNNYMMQLHAFDWEEISQSELDDIYKNSYRNIMDNDYKNVDLRLFFMSSVWRGNQDIDKVIAIIESLNAVNVSDHERAFYLYILYFAKYYVDRETANKDAFIKYLRNSEKSAQLLNPEWNRHTLFFLGKNGDIVAAPKRLLSGDDVVNIEKYENVLGKVFDLSLDRMQSGKVTLGIDSAIKAFFVPYKTKLNAYEHRNADVQFALGFSYSGLRAWEVKLRPEY